MSTAFKLIAWITVASSALGLAGCSKEPASTASSSAAAAALPAGLFVSAAPPAARSVAAIKADAQPAGEVVVHGRVGGRQDPFVDGVAMFLLADAGMKSCDELHGDACSTPWDYCCEPPESLSAKVVTVQVVGTDGKPLRLDLKGRHGIEPLARLTVAGEIASRAGGTLVINARQIHVSPAGR